MSTKLTGKIKVFDAKSGAALGRWGGTECLLSIESDFGPVLIVKTASQPMHKGTFYDLPKISSVVGMKASGGKYTIPTGVSDGVLSFIVTRLQRTANVQIKVPTEQVDTLTKIAEFLGMGLSGAEKWERLPLDINVGRSKRKRAEGESAAQIRLEQLKGALDTPDMEPCDGQEAEEEHNYPKKRCLVTERNLELAEKSHAMQGPSSKERLNDWVLNNIVVF